MKKMLMIGLGLIISSSASAEQAKPESVKELMIISGAIESTDRMLSQMLPALKNTVPDSSPAYWDEAVREVDTNQLIERMVPIYQKYLTQEDLEAIIDFYGTSAGKKLIELQPSIMRESIQVGQVWIQEVATDLARQYREIHPESQSAE